MVIANDHYQSTGIVCFSVIGAFSVPRVSGRSALIFDQFCANPMGCPASRRGWGLNHVTPTQWPHSWKHSVLGISVITSGLDSVVRITWRSLGSRNRDEPGFLLWRGLTPPRCRDRDAEGVEAAVWSWGAVGAKGVVYLLPAGIGFG